MERNGPELSQCDAQLTHGCCSSFSCELNNGCALCVLCVCVGGGGVMAGSSHCDQESRWPWNSVRKQMSLEFSSSVLSGGGWVGFIVACREEGEVVCNLICPHVIAVDRSEYGEWCRNPF